VSTRLTIALTAALLVFGALAVIVVVAISVSASGRSAFNPTVALVTVTILVAMGVTTLWSVRLHLGRNQILGMLAVLALIWVTFIVIQPAPTHRFFDPR
jgi:hypothetical protein